MTDTSQISTVLAHFPADCRPAGEPTPGAGGFSGSRVWRLETRRGSLCLRRWSAEHPDPARLRYIHAVLDTVARAGFALVPVPIRTSTGESFVEHQDHLWELTPWFPGSEKRTSQGIEPALTALAQFHLAAANYPTDPPHGSAPGIVNRRIRTIDYLTGRLDLLAGEIAANHDRCPELLERASRFVPLFQTTAPRVLELLTVAVCLEVPLQPCIRDIHREHVLFVDDAVTAIIDFGAMQPDSIACDIARLLGSLALDDADGWNTGLAAYHAARPLSAVERSLVRAYDESAVLLSGLNWLRWVFVDSRLFENREGVLARFDEIMRRLAHLADRKPSAPVSFT